MARGKSKIVTSYTKRGRIPKTFRGKQKLTTAGFKRGGKR